ncbi:hypothetical protein TH66_17850 [Carbonactinospora thermoautotrophica]|uniref:Transcriptional regulator n=1 Tax=Carbonactinospora thermoautotrophica TaxID=1469144 RepID=A0A132MI72_9ACTN|nr:GntR family transcriptional regulator [Carbonactinospora thermoautotrophica]KWW97493.1 hypothetical protein TH66_17850 [Carbonactinospora thermoautotrophica]KWW98784.1 Transcriptional regulator [Carbonactinospora thermoautotrophica]KWX06954.1 hypothetical protein TR74_20385 [Carbonactinospora thermoautotrophica]
MEQGLTLSIDTRSAVPPFEQIRAQISDLVDSGVLPPGTRLPTVRQLAADLGLAVGTVARAYRELEAAGTVITRRRTGTRVADVTETSTKDQIRLRLDEAARRYVQASRRLGVDDRLIIEAVRRALNQEHQSEGRQT